MSFERDCAIVMASVGDWLTKSRAGFSTNEKQNSNQTLYTRFFPPFEQVSTKFNLYSIFDFLINYEKTALQIFFYFVRMFFGS